MNNLLGYLGPKGTYSEETALRYSADTHLKPKPYPSFEQIFAAVEKKEIPQAVIPVENSLQGSVNLTFDLFAKDRPVKIRGELLLKIRHCLMARPGQKVMQIEEVYSHPQALAQCRLYLDQNMPQAARIPASSTAEAAEFVARDKNKALIASDRTARLYSLEVLREDIQDKSPNVTRFLLIGLSDKPPTGSDKTSLLISLQDRPGSLYSALGIFARHDLNLTKIEPRPARETLGKYIFFLDIEGHRKEKKVEQALAELKKTTLFVKVLGSYPLARQTFL
ncbi:MAG: prephenate dehydratase [Firmicutes bacterium]|nr:prephenate dehydratase [Bacillota bacterium]